MPCAFVGFLFASVEKIFRPYVFFVWGGIDPDDYQALRVFVAVVVVCGRSLPHCQNYGLIDFYHLPDCDLPHRLCNP
jgi:hypothetical protein